MRKRSFCLMFIFTLIVLAGCAVSPNYIVHPDMVGQVQPTTRIGIIMGSAKCFRIEAGGKAKLDEESTGTMKACIEEGVIKAFAEAGYAAKMLSADQETDRILETYNGVRKNVRNQFPGSPESVSNPVNFGNLSSFMERNEVDLIAVIQAHNELSTTGRKATRAALSVFFIPTESDGGLAEVAIIGQDGKLLYHDYKGGNDLTNAKSAARVFKTIVENIQLANKPS